MDLWDLTKLLLRRWYLAAPMLLMSVVLVFLIAQSVQPDYSAKGYLQMIPPPGSRSVEDPDAKPRPRNPWLDLGYPALGNAVVLKVTDATRLEQMHEAGFSDSVTITMNERSPLLEIEVVATSAAQATATVRELIKRINAEISAAQGQYGVLREDTITTLTLNDGSNVEVVTSKIKRVLIVAAGVGLLVTTAGTIALDTMLRRRARRTLGLGEEQLGSGRFGSGLTGAPAPRRRWSMDDESGSGRNGYTSPAPILSRPAALPAGLPMSPSSLSRSAGPVTVMLNMPSDSVEATDIQTAAAGDQSDGPTATTGQLYGAPVGADGPNGDDGAAVGGQPDDATDSLPIPPDATIVLPLSNVSKRDDRNSRR